MDAEPQDNGTADPDTSESGLADDDLAPVWTDGDRPPIPRVAGEREALTAYLDHYRATVEMKCRGLTVEQARSRPVRPPSPSARPIESTRSSENVPSAFQRNSPT